MLLRELSMFLSKKDNTSIQLYMLESGCTRILFQEKDTNLAFNMSGEAH